ncbi:AAA-domain-containing protein [Yamadazyma tenuis]|uniref:AAA-domain-containing protein n=1 Tax=Candida tenuis (strain ATCC 10573 / BCRC 21748 / CBS 615 / JCM 9827 / NBRC 10315 / NRRL Y-1498 / VKM Y-70) TaxID=590646 RepID=G3B949_CANTC|nr:AAA-domain-containing protein [Yamadazyma tenuis ATCC 10573]EGV62461.1 AAA-domain-containing protein [Yamadazyma tenuis ATCC 10573]WEJ93747.1 AAA-domain-containing protein [Yamadazyma tenuis]
MFQRKRPPQLTVQEELRQTYADCCNLSIKNLTLEEDNRVEDALKGWKSLHTSLLFKLELFEKSITKMGQEELDVFNELRSIRDQNVKHLIRVQLRMDELNRRQLKSASTTSVASSTSGKSNMTVPSLRSGSGGMRNLSNGNVQKKKMLKSLRQQPQQSSLKSKHNQHQANTAANVSWQKPSITVVDTGDDDEAFDDFDQDLAVGWDKISDEDAHTPPNLIDLDGDYFQLSHSMENLSLKPKSRHSSMSSNSNSSPNNSIMNLQPLRPEKPQSKSTPDIRPHGNGDVPSGAGSKTSTKSQVPASSEKKYIYNKPKPMNISRLMKKPQTPSTSSTSPKKAATSTKPKATAPARLGPAPIKKSNITYNYVSSSKKSTRAESPTPTSTPVPAKKQASDESSESDENEDFDMRDLLNPKVQNKVIESVRGIDVDAAKSILNDIVVHGDEVYWEDIVGLDNAKNSLKEAVVYPFLRPDLFKGLREPTRGMLLFGPPGTGKTMLARAVATESKSTFFSITASSITSKYLGESEKLVRALFVLAKRLSPSIVFIDEIDSLLGSRNEGELESTRRIKNEFLIQWSELSSSTTKEDDANELKHQVLILGATNMPWSIDEAARRRFVKRQYIPLPEDETRANQVKRLLKYQKHTLEDADFQEIIKLTAQFSGSDITALCKDSAMGPLRSLGELLLSTPTEEIRPMNMDDFRNSLKFIKPSVSYESLSKYEDWAKKFGSSGV